MKKLLLIILSLVVLLSINISVKAQESIKNGLNVGTTTTGIKNISNAELKTIDSIKVGMPIQRQIDGTFKIKDGRLTYNATQIDALVATLKTSSFANQVKSISGVDYLFPISCGTIFAGNSALTDNDAQYVAYYNEYTRTVSKFCFMMYTSTASYTGDQYNGMALYSYSTSTGLFTEVCRTVNDPDFWKGAPFVLITKNMPSSYVLAPGIYYVGLVYNNSAQTTAPILCTFGNIGSFSTSILGIHSMAHKTVSNDLITTGAAQSAITGTTIAFQILLRN